MFFDSHWHARDWDESDKETVLRSLLVAEAAGIDAIAAMPNTFKPLTSLERCLQYLSLADSYKGPVRFFVHIGLTPDVEQVKRAVEAARLEPRIIGLKAYWGSSTGNLLIGKEEEQFRVLETLAREGFEGVLVGHYEDEEEIDVGLYDSKNPITWSTLCRPEIVEISSFRKINRAAEKAKFKGKLHVAHVSSLEVVDEIAAYEPKDDEHRLQLSCDVALHTLVFNDEMLSGPYGAQYKCNPPLRAEKTRSGLLKRLLAGKIPMLISDHAPHSVAAKSQQVPASGIASGLAWPRVVKYLRGQGISESVLADAGFFNALELYGLKLFKEEQVVNSVSDSDNSDRILVKAEPVVPKEPWKYVKRSGRCDLKKLAELQKQYPVDVYSFLK